MHFTLSNSTSTSTMKILQIAFLIFSCFVSRCKVFSSLIPDRAPAPVSPSDCLCQCDGTTFLDSEGNLQGNCKTADYTNRKWCYINSDKETMEACGDAFDYDTRYQKFKSYAACASPDPYSEECYFGHF